MLPLLAVAGYGWLNVEIPPHLFAWHPDLLIVHHSATPPEVDGRRVDAAFIDTMHAQRGFSTYYHGKLYHIGYHYVILPDGTVQPGRPEGCIGAHARRVNSRALGICLIGDFSSTDNPDGRAGPIRPSEAQMRSLVRLSAYLVRKYDIPLRNVRRHRDVGQTACPGDRFPNDAYHAELENEVMK